MILNYKGYNNVWCYEEADVICHANVYVGDITKKYRENGEKWLEMQDKIKETTKVEGFDTEGVGLSYSTEMMEMVTNRIINETHCHDEIVFHISTSFEEMENLCIVVLQGKRTYAFSFDFGVYLLNNHGETVQRLT